MSTGHRFVQDQLRSEANGDHVAAVVSEDVTSTLTSASQIPASARFITATSSNANYAITLPRPVTGHQIWIQLNGGTNCELRTPAASGNTINNVDSDGTNEAVLTATSLYTCIATSSTSWIVRGHSNQGADEGTMTPN
jgi:hypothetical protein